MIMSKKARDKQELPVKTAKQTRLTVALGFALAATLAAPRLTAGTAIDPDADRIFNAACKYLAGAKAFCVKVEVWKDEVLPTGQKLQTTRTLELQEQRPDQLRIEERSPRTNRGFWYQKRSLIMLDRSMNLYGVMEVPGNIDAVLDAVEERFGIEIPLGDVLVADPYKNVMDSTDSAEDLGMVTMLGTVCHHLAFTGVNADAQVWIADGPKPLPRKIVINFKNIAGSPQVTQIYSDWDVVTPISDSVFTFVPPDGANKITVNPSTAQVASEQATADASAKK